MRPSAASSRRLWNVLRSAGLELAIAIASVAILAPLAIMALGSFKDAASAARLNLEWPKLWHFDNYAVVIEKGKLSQAFANSALITFTVMAATVLSSAMAAFYLDRTRTKTSGRILKLFQLGLIAPMAMIPSIKLLQWFHLNGSYAGAILILIAINIPFSVFLFSGFYKTIPRVLDEAGIIDGCGPFRLFFQVVFPLLLPIVVTNAIIVFMSVWNDMTIPLFFLNSSDKWTMPLTVYNFFGQYSRDWNLVFADLILTACPVLVFYLLGQRFIIDGMTTGSVKG